VAVDALLAVHFFALTSTSYYVSPQAHKKKGGKKKGKRGGDDKGGVPAARRARSRKSADSFSPSCLL